jgi:hypothetical protein
VIGIDSIIIMLIVGAIAERLAARGVRPHQEREVG